MEILFEKKTTKLKKKITFFCDCLKKIKKKPGDIFSIKKICLKKFKKHFTDFFF